MLGSSKLRKGGDSDFAAPQRGVTEEKSIVIGIVKVNNHQARMGNLMVYVPGLGDNSRENEESQWRQVRYCTPFYSRTNTNSSATTDVGVKNVAGIVYPAPDIGTQVLCFFPEGNNQKGFWFACAPDDYMMQSLPESSSTDNVSTDGRNKKQPALEFNDVTHDTSRLSNFLKPTRAVDSLKAETLKTQGLDLDEIRGLTVSSYTRETPSELIGITSKGRKIDKDGVDIKNRLDILKALNDGDNLKQADAMAVEGRVARKHGHSFVLDDGDIAGNSDLIRLRTAGGHQILLHDTEDLIYISNSKGTTWIQIDADGKLDIFSETSINLRTQNINMHADENIKMHAGNSVQIVAKNSLHLESGNATDLFSTGSTKVAGSNSLHLTGNNTQLEGQTVGFKSTGNMDLYAKDIIALQGKPAGASSPSNATVIVSADTQKDDKGYWGATSGVSSTVDRVPTHEPYANHGATLMPTVTSKIAVSNETSPGASVSGVATTVSESSGVASPIDILKENISKLQSSGVTNINAAMSTASNGLDALKSELNSESVSPINILKENISAIGIGKLQSSVVTNINAAITEQISGKYNLIDSATNAIGKYGFTADVLKENGFVRPEVELNGELMNSAMWTGKEGIKSAASFLAADVVQEKLNINNLENVYTNAVNSGVIQEGDNEADIAGMMMVSVAAGVDNAKKLREQEALTPRPIVGTTVSGDLDADQTAYNFTNDVKQWYKKGVAAATQAKSEDHTGYSADFQNKIG